MSEQRLPCSPHAGVGVVGLAPLIIIPIRLWLIACTLSDHFLGRPVHQLVNANISSADHVAATKCMKACRRGQEVRLFFK